MDRLGGTRSREKARMRVRTRQTTPRRILRLWAYFNSKKIRYTVAKHVMFWRKMMRRIFILVLLTFFSGSIAFAAQAPGYSIAKATYIVKNIKISYPQISNMKDLTKQRKINEIIRQDALAEVKYHDDLSKELFEEADYFVEKNYKITWMGPNLLSVQYSGYFNQIGTAHPTNTFSTININVSKGTKIKLREFLTLDQRFVEIFRKAKYQTKFRPSQEEKVKLDEAIKGELNMFSINEWIDYFKKADNLAEDNEAAIFSYFTKDSLGVSIQVAHAIGDHVEFELKFRDIADHINRNSEIWSDLRGKTE